MIKLSILICTIEKRKNLFNRLITQLEQQITDEVEVLFCSDNQQASIGTKRNALLDQSIGKYICFIDDDDRISANYIQLLLEGIKTGADCCSLIGEMTINSRQRKRFIHSLDYNHYFEKNGIYYRPPNHLNCIKSSIAKKFIFPALNRNEDTNWAMQIADAGVLKTEHKIEQVIYFYDYIPRK